MKAQSIKTIAIFMLAVVLGGLLFTTSQNVQKADDDLQNIRAEIEAERETISVLEVEWEYLNRPQRLEELAKRTLKMKVPGEGDMTDDMDYIPEPSSSEFKNLVIPGAKPASYNRGAVQ